MAVSHFPAFGPQKVLADRTQLQQVIVNLAVNAVQAIAQAGSTNRNISIRTARARSRHLALLGRGQWSRYRAAARDAPVRQLLHDQGQRHGHGIAHLSFGHRGAWRAD